MGKNKNSSYCTETLIVEIIDSEIEYAVPNTTSLSPINYIDSDVLLILFL